MFKEIPAKIEPAEEKDISKKAEDFGKELSWLNDEIVNKKNYSPEILSRLFELDLNGELKEYFFEQEKTAGNKVEEFPMKQNFEEIKKGLVFALRGNFLNFLGSLQGEEKLDEIEKALDALGKISAGDKPLEGFDVWLLRNIWNQKDNPKTAGLVLKLLEIPTAKFDYELALEILANRKEESQAKILDRLGENAGQIGQQGAKRLAVVLADLLGAEKARDEIKNEIEKEKAVGDENSKRNFEFVYSLITPNSDKQAITNLQSFYQNNIKFEEYEVNQKMNEGEVELLENLIGKNEKVLEMGCGTGRLIKELAKDGYDISGFDFTERHVEIAQQEIEQAGGEAKVFQGDWHANALKDESFETVYSLGRNILHDYSILDQVQLFREAKRILRPGGKFIFDIPDREKGGYKKMVDEYANEMQKRGIKNYSYGTIYDSPDGEHFATRYAYSVQDIKDLADIAGFRIASVERRPLETGQDDENLYFVLEKKV